MSANVPKWMCFMHMGAALILTIIGNAFGFSGFVMALCGMGFGYWGGVLATITLPDRPERGAGE